MTGIVDSNIEAIDFDGTYVLIVEEGLLNGVPIFRDLENTAREFKKVSPFLWSLTGADGHQLVKDSISSEDTTIPLTSDVKWDNPSPFFLQAANVTLTEGSTCVY